MNLLSLDLGTKTGYAYSGRDGKMHWGTKTLATPKEITFSRKLRMDRRGDPRFFTFLNLLKKIHLQVALDYILFEDVLFSSTTMQTQLWAGFRSAVWLMSDYGVQIDCVPVGTLKKSASGSGAATKEAMACALCRADSRFKLNFGDVVDTMTGENPDDNAVDAIHLYRWGLQHLRK